MREHQLVITILQAHALRLLLTYDGGGLSANVWPQLVQGGQQPAIVREAVNAQRH